MRKCWTVKHGSIKSILENYDELKGTWKTSKNIVTNTEMKTRIIGVESKMETCHFVFGLLLGETIFVNCDNLSMALQSSSASAYDDQSTESMTDTNVDAHRFVL